MPRVLKCFIKQLLVSTALVWSSLGYTLPVNNKKSTRIKCHGNNEQINRNNGK